MARIFIASAVTIAGLSAAFVACEPTNKQEAPALYPEQASASEISAFDNSIKSIGRIENAVSMIVDPSTAPQDPIADKIRRALTSLNCQVAYVKNQSTETEKTSLLKISGSNCPLSASYSKQILTNGKVTFSASFVIFDSALAAQNDIYSLSISGQGRSTTEQNKETQTTVFELQSLGEIQSQSQGKIAFSVATAWRQSSLAGHKNLKGYRRIGLQFPKFLVTVKSDMQVINDNDYTLYSMNDKPISKDEFYSYLLPLGIIVN